MRDHCMFYELTKGQGVHLWYLCIHQLLWMMLSRSPVRHMPLAYAPHVAKPAPKGSGDNIEALDALGNVGRCHSPSSMPLILHSTLAVQSECV